MAAKAPTNRKGRVTSRRAAENGDFKALEKSLTARQRRFCYEYIVDFNQTQAVLRAGYVTDYPSRQANNLMKHEGVLALIQTLKAQKKNTLTTIDPQYVISKITEIVSDPDAKHADQLRGLELLAKHLGMFIERQELTGKDGGPLSVAQEEIKQEAAEIVGLLQRLNQRVESDKSDKKEASNVVELKRA